MFRRKNISLAPPMRASHLAWHSTDRIPDRLAQREEQRENDTLTRTNDALHARQKKLKGDHHV